MKKISFFKKLRLYFTYRKIINVNKEYLEKNFNIRVDQVSRIYTVLNLPKEFFDEPYNLRKQDIDNISKSYIREYSNQLSQYLDSIGLTELYDFYRTEKVDKYSYLLVFGYSLFKTDDLARNILFKYIPVTLILIVISILIFIL